jgi:hypothetical protein
MDEFFSPESFRPESSVRFATKLDFKLVIEQLSECFQLATELLDIRLPSEFVYWLKKTE